MKDDIEDLDTETKTFVALGIPAFKTKNRKEHSSIKFSYDVTDNDAKELIMEIRDGNRTIYTERIIDPLKLTKKDGREWEWDGFENDGILDTARLTKYKFLNLYTTAIDNDGNYSRKKLDFKLKYKEVDWVDIKINRKTIPKRIDVTLRVNIKDGGENGTQAPLYFDPIYTDEKPWLKIPDADINFWKRRSGATIIKRRPSGKGFEDLEKLALEGVNYHWGRNNNHQYE